MTLAPTGVVKLERATIEGADFRRASFERFAPMGCLFLRCDFRGLSFDHRVRQVFSSRVQSTFRECAFDDADLRRAGPGQSRFERCTFDGARFEKWTSLCGEFVDCHFAGPLVGATFYGRPHGSLATMLSPHRATNEFRGNDFRQAELLDTAFLNGVAFAAQLWPDGAGHVRLDRLHERIERGRRAVASWKDPMERQAATSLLLALSDRHGEQDEIVRQKIDPRASVPASVQLRLWETLAQPL